MTALTFRFETSPIPELVDDQFVCVEDERYVIQCFDGMFFVNFNDDEGVMHSNDNDYFLVLDNAKAYVAELMGA